MPTRILVLSDIWVPFPGGAERLVFNLARDLARRGAVVDVLTGYEAAQAFDGPPVVYWPIGTGENHSSGWAAIHSTIAKLQPDVILTHHHYAFEFEAELLASGIPVVQVVLNTRRLPGAALAVYISRWVRDQCGDAHPGDLVITPPALADIVAETHGDAIGFVKPYLHKGVGMVYASAALLPRRRFLILRGEWQTLEEVHEMPNITFLEPVVDMRDFYRECRLVLMPSVSEDAGTVAQEATLNGLPCISSNAGGLAETNGGGIRLGLESVRSWVKAIKSLDDPLTYARTVERQRHHLEMADHAGSLATLAERIDALASG